MELQIGDAIIAPGHRQRLELPVARLPTQTLMSLPIEVIRGADDGPRVWLSAALHGDELNGVEIIHRVTQRLHPRRMSGAVIAVPVVNVFGFINRTRDLPDGRDLNRSFPGSPRGSLAGRLAHLFMTQIVGQCTHGIDLHTAGGHRTNLPQVRCNLEDADTRKCAEAFAAPIMIQGDAPPGSLREVVAHRGVPIIAYEAGEPHRFNAEAISIGVQGVLRVLAKLGMIRNPYRRPTRQPMEAASRTWLRARRSGMLRLSAKLGQWVYRDQQVGVIYDAFGGREAPVTSPDAGLVIGHTNHPLVSEGEAILHIARQVTTRRRRA